MRDLVTAATAVLVLVAVVVATCATGIRAAGLAATLSAVAWFDFFLAEPYNSFTINDANDVEAAVLLLVIGGIVWGPPSGACGGRTLRRQTGYLGGVLATAETLAAHHESRDEVTQAVAQRIVEVLDLDSCRFISGPRPDPGAPTLEQDGSLVRDGHHLNVERDGLPVDSTMVLPVRSGGQVRGHFVLTAATHVARPGAEQRRVASLLADQVAGG